jgi:hypothetical protein
MKENETHIIKPRDIADIVKAPTNDSVGEFLEQPLLASIESITGFLASGPKEWTLAIGRIVQAPLKAKLFEQVAREINEFRNKGKVPDNFAEQKHGAQTWTELFTMIDQECPDDERLDALKAMFFSVNKVTAEDAERVLQYQLFQIAKKLNSNDLMVLKAVYESAEVNAKNTLREWMEAVSHHLGHALSALVERGEVNLVEHRLLSPRLEPDRLRVAPHRLTDLGTKFCDTIKWYHIEKNRMRAGWQ